MSLLDKFHTPPAIVDSIERYGVNPAGLTVEVDGCATEGVVNGQRVVLAGTNNYLGLTFDPLCIDAAIGALITHGTGTTGSRMANGTYSDHSLLELELADFFEARSAIVFTTGYQANLGMISALTGPDDLILLDADSHASIYDGAKLSGAQIYRFPHNDVNALERRLQRLGERAKRTLVVVEGLYSMMGDRAPLREMTEVAHRYGALILVDEAHSMGVLGERGRGRAEEEGVLRKVDFLVGTFSKSLGSIGGYCVSPHIDLDVMRASIRAYMFTASSAPSVIAAARAGLRIVRERPELRARLWRNANDVYRALRSMGFEVGPEASPVVPVRFDDMGEAVDAWHALLASGVYVNLVAPPASPGNFSLLRCSLSAGHTREQVQRIIDGFGKLRCSLGQRYTVRRTAAASAR
jgi:8-amino-7-oxononanoate synthase